MMCAEVDDMQEQDYLEILKQSLTKKLAVLREIRKMNEQQRVLLLNENLTPEEFEQNIESKGKLVDSLDLLDEGFENVYQRVQEEITGNKEQYKSQIQALQDLIRDVTEESSSIQAEEQRNYQLAQRKFSDVKKQIREVKASQNAVQQYYQNMRQVNYIDPQFMDDKK